MIFRHPVSYILISLAFLASALLCPWWLTVVIGILALSFWRAYGVVVFGGILMDLIFGAYPGAMFPYIFTTVFMVAALFTWYLDRAILE